MVGLLTAEGNFDAAVQLEQLWNELRTKLEFALFVCLLVEQLQRARIAVP